MDVNGVKVIKIDMKWRVNDAGCKEYALQRRIFSFYRFK